MRSTRRQHLSPRSMHCADIRKTFHTVLPFVRSSTVEIGSATSRLLIQLMRPAATASSVAMDVAKWIRVGHCIFESRKGRTANVYGENERFVPGHENRILEIHASRGDFGSVEPRRTGL